MKAWWVSPVLLLLSATLASALFARRQGFPHDEHRQLFPLCEGCHLGVTTADSAASYPPAALCARCHDGVDQERVEWTAPTHPIDNLRFDHVAHAGEVAAAGEPLACESCHSPAGGGRMDVQRTIVGQCLDCHAHRASAHLTDADCSTCHVPLAETRYTAARVLELPLPADHEQANFLEGVHGDLARTDITRCSTCHTRERCTSCHVNAARVQSITALPVAGPSLELPRFAAEYPLPQSHRSPAWIETHGRNATTETCATCHTREGCESCHRGRAPHVVASMPRAREASAPGAPMTALAPASHAVPRFVENHGTLAATGRTTCMTCHTRETCAACHERSALADVQASDPVDRPVRLATDAAAAAHTTTTAADTGRRATRRATAESQFHPPTFMLRHSTAAYGRRLECANCHDVRVFCRDCHLQAGFDTGAGQGRLRTVFHDAEPVWLLRHARAARQGLESCTSCHTQRDCLQCHSQVGAFRINPHGDGFDARRAHQRNPVICFACHLTDPLGGSS